MGGAKTRYLKSGFILADDVFFSSGVRITTLELSDYSGMAITYLYNCARAASNIKIELDHELENLLKRDMAKKSLSLS